MYCTVCTFAADRSGILRKIAMKTVLGVVSLLPNMSNYNYPPTTLASQAKLNELSLYCILPWLDHFPPLTFCKHHGVALFLR